MQRELIRHLPLSNPRFQLLALLLIHTRGRSPSFPMDTLLCELPGVEPPGSSPTPQTTHTWTPRARSSQKGQKRKQNITKFVNLPPDPLYYYEDNLRKVHPYYFTFNTFCKERWRGKTLLEVFATEFRDRPVEYYVPLSPPPDCVGNRNGY